MTPTDTAADAAITAACTELHLPTIRAEAGHLADQATKANATHRAYLAEVLSAEVDDRAERRRQRRVARGPLPRAQAPGGLRHHLLAGHPGGDRRPGRGSVHRGRRAGLFLGDAGRASPTC